MNKQQKEQLLADVTKVAAKYHVDSFIMVFSHVSNPGQVLDEIEIAALSLVSETSKCKTFFQWLRRQIILKLQ